MRSFVKIKPSRIGNITRSFTDIGKSCTVRDFFYVASVSFNSICENKILTKISEFTAHVNPDLSCFQNTVDSHPSF